MSGLSVHAKMQGWQFITYTALLLLDTICIVSLVIERPDIDMDACRVSGLHFLFTEMLLATPRLLDASADVATLTL